MKYNVLGYLIGEGFGNVFKNKKQATSIGIMCIAMLAFGICFIIAQNLNHFVGQVQTAQGIQVFIKEGATEEEKNKIKEDILALNGVTDAKFVSKEEAFDSVKEGYADKAYLIEPYKDIFTESYIVTLSDLKLSKEVQNTIQSFDGVKKITSSDQTISTLVTIAKWIKIITYIVVVALVVGAIYIISNTIKLTVDARKREISIMKYVGATNGFIRLPFVVEGVLIGIIAGGISVSVVGALYILLEKNEALISFLAKLGLTLLKFGDMLNLILIVYIILGVGIGILGSSLSMRKYLKV